jgi:MerR family transcriptional regulator, light-induced transcriptional regulator
MTDFAERTARPMAASPAAGAPLESLASRALDLIASKRVSSASLLSERLIEDLEGAVCSSDPGRRWTVVGDMLDSGIRREDIADFYVPEVARRLGAAWCEDTASFADVTIGSARLQGLLREIGADWFSDARLDACAPCLLVVVLADEYHTLGAMVLGAQLGRLGVSVKLVMGRNDADLLEVVATGQFDAIFISVSQEAQISALGRLVKKIRTASLRATPIVIGGSVVTRVTDVKTKTGADHATTDTREALRACGLTISASGARRRVTSE